MLTGFTIKPPFFEIGPKAYMYGERAIKLARAADTAARKYSVDVIFTPQPTDIYPIAREVPALYVCAQHMDALNPGRGLGSVLPEALKEAGARGVMLNHAEKPLPLGVLKATIRRAEEAGLFSIVCADSIAEAKAIAQLKPDIIVAEPSELIGGARAAESDYVLESIRAVKSIDARIRVLLGAGIRTGEDVYRVILAGADATGSSSAICACDDPEAVMDEMLCAAKEAYAKRTNNM